jgi:DMSO/TMAO reductase YedYZ molybdopterin-dependent catalytic subunit
VAGEASGISREELQLAARNHGTPLEALRYPITPLGLHYLLLHFDIPQVDAATWRLTMDGLVRRPLALTLAEIRERPEVEYAVTMECAGNGRARLSPRPFSQPWLDEAVGTAIWSGASLRSLLDEAGLASGAVEVVFTGLDRGTERGVEQAYARSLTVEQALAGDAFLAYSMNGEPLPPQHGFPLRLVVPGWYGMASVKWLTSISVVDAPFTGPQQVEAYRFRLSEAEDGLPLTRMLPRALMAPPGIPDFPTRERTLDAGPCLLEGRAWSGSGSIASVAVSTDGGKTWNDAIVRRDVDSAWAWSSWHFSWEASPGEHELCCSASDEAGNVQPLEPAWNVGGYANNAVQRVRVSVRDRPAAQSS